MGNKCSKGTEIVEGVVCKESDVPENGMKEYELNGGKVLLVKQKGILYAVGTKCSHYGAPLSTGALGDGRVRCPWHGACFSLITGDIEDHPGLDSIPCYDVSVLDNGDVKVCGKKPLLQANIRVKPMARKILKTSEIYVIIGAGAAGSSCAETLRQEGFVGRIVMITNEKHLPYDRVKVSKQLDSDIAKITLRSKEFYNENNIEILTNENVTSLNTEHKVVETESGKTYKYTRVLVAAGVKPRLPTFIPGHELENIYVVRTIDDANKINSLLTSELNVVIIGSSFIGMESAAFCTNKVKSVTVIGKSTVPFENILGLEIGKQIAGFFESKGVKFVMNASVLRFEDADNKLSAVVMQNENGEVNVPADICIVGLGVQYDTKFLSNTNIALTKHGAIEVNEYMQSNVKDVFAGGDIAYAPIYGYDTKGSIGHWQLAQYHGRLAALNMVGKQTPLQSVPFFFSMLFGKGLRYAGHGVGFDDVFTVGNLEELKFVAYFCKGDQVLAVGTIASDPVAARFAELVYSGKKLLKSEAQDNKWLSAVV